MRSPSHSTSLARPETNIAKTAEPTTESKAQQAEPKTTEEPEQASNPALPSLDEKTERALAHLGRIASAEIARARIELTYKELEKVIEPYSLSRSEIRGAAKLACKLLPFKAEEPKAGFNLALIIANAAIPGYENLTPYDKHLYWPVNYLADDTMPGHKNRIEAITEALKTTINSKSFFDGLIPLVAAKLHEGGGSTADSVQNWINEQIKSK